MFVRSSGDPAGGSDRRRRLIFIAIAVAVGYLLVTGLSTLWTDFLWYQSVGYAQVWQVNLLANVGLGVFGLVVVFGFVWANLALTDRLSPRLELLDLGEDEELVERFRDWVEPRLRWVRLGVAAAFAVLVGLAAVAWREELLLFLNPVDFGVSDPQFGNDVGFYVFRLPLLEAVVGWLFNLVILTGVLVVALHYLNGGIRLQRGAAPTMRSGVKAHISGLVALLALLKAVDYRIDAYRLLYSPDGQFFGAGFTDVNARLPALDLLALVSLLAVVLLLWNIRRQGWTLAIVSVGAWAFVSLAAAVVYPAIVQRFQVNPNELARERPFIERNIEATRQAFGLEAVEVRDYNPTPDLTAEDIEENRLTIDNLRLWDPEVLTSTYRNLQEIRSYYRVDRVDTDRYVLDGTPTQVMVAARELDYSNPDAIPSDWQNFRLRYTHGFGMVLSPANEVESDGQPRLMIRDVPPVSDAEGVDVDQTRIYFGETHPPGEPVIVKTGDEPQEVDFPLEGDTASNEYDGEAGVGIGSLIRRLAFAIRYQDLNILISSQLRPDSRVLMERNLSEMLDKIAPFLSADADPYPVLHDGRVKWIVDLYTTSDDYPYSQPVSVNDSRRLQVSSGLPRTGYNYIRNSVKAVVDAYDGTVDLYVADEADPVVQAWSRAYPGVLQDFSEMPDGLVDHLRYPQDLFKIQSEKYLAYHITDPGEFFSEVDVWAVPSDPSTALRTGDNRLWGDTLSADGSVNNLEVLLPYYLMVSLPGEDSLSYTLVQPFTPRERPNMSSILVADSTPERYGRLIDYRLPRGSLVEGTGQVNDRIEQNDEISSQFTLWRGQGSNVLRGDMLVVPIEESIMYVQPVYLEAQGAGLPEFRQVIVVFGDRIEWDDSLGGALAEVFGEPVGDEEPGDEPADDGDTGDGEDQPPLEGTVAELLQQANDAFEQAETALRAGDLAEYQRLVEEAQRLVQEALSQVDDPSDLEAYLPGALLGS